MKRICFFFLCLGLFLWAQESKAVDYITSASCTASGSSACNVNGCFVCNGTTWVPQALIVGTGSTCDAAHAGMLQYTGGVVQYCNGSAWSTMGSSSGTGGQSVFNGWPDVIVCSTANGPSLLYNIGSPWGDGKYGYRAIAPNTSYDIYYTSSGSYYGNANFSTTDCVTNAWSISYLVANGKAFNYTNGGANGAAAMADGTAGAPGLYFSANTNTGLYRPTTDNLAVATGGVERLRVTATGSVGIGTTSPGTKLEVNGPINAISSSYFAVAGNLVGGAGAGVSGYVSAEASNGVQGIAQLSSSSGVYASNSGTGCNGYLAYGSYSAGGSCSTNFASDIRLKKDIAPVQNGLDIVMKLRPVSYLWKTDRKNHDLETDKTKKAHNYGFIAQDVMKILPDLVTETPPEMQPPDKPGAAPKKLGKAEVMYGLDYNGFISPAIRAIQELKAENDAMRARLDALEAHLK